MNVQACQWFCHYLSVSCLVHNMNLTVNQRERERENLEGIYMYAVVLTLPFYVFCAEGLPPDLVQRFSGGKKKAKRGGAGGGGADGEEELVDTPTQGALEPVKIILTFKRYVFDPQKKMIQT